MSDNPFQDDLEFNDVPDFDKSTHSTTKSKTEMTLKDISSITDKNLKYQQLKAREAELLDRKRMLENSINETKLVNNWPHFYPLLRFEPLIDLPRGSVKCVESSLYNLVGVTVSSMFNFLSVLCMISLPDYDILKCLIYSLLQGYAFFYFVYNYGYLTLYSACRKHDIPFRFILYQIFICCVCTYFLLGFPDSGCVGIATMLDSFAKLDSFFPKMIAFMNTSLLAVNLYFSIRTLYASQEYQKVSGNDNMLMERSDHDQ